MLEEGGEEEEGEGGDAETWGMTRKILTHIEIKGELLSKDGTTGEK